MHSYCYSFIGHFAKLALAYSKGGIILSFEVKLWDKIFENYKKNMCAQEAYWNAFKRIDLLHSLFLIIKKNFYNKATKTINIGTHLIQNIKHKITYIDSELSTL